MSTSTDKYQSVYQTILHDIRARVKTIKSLNASLEEMKDDDCYEEIIAETHEDITTAKKELLYSIRSTITILTHVYLMSIVRIDRILTGWVCTVGSNYEPSSIYKVELKDVKRILKDKDALQIRDGCVYLLAGMIANDPDHSFIPLFEELCEVLLMVQ